MAESIETERVGGLKWPDGEAWWLGIILTIGFLTLATCVVAIGWALVSAMGAWILLIPAGIGLIAGIGWVVSLIGLNRGWIT